MYNWKGRLSSAQRKAAKNGANGEIEMARVRAEEANTKKNKSFRSSHICALQTTISTPYDLLLYHPHPGYAHLCFLADRKRKDEIPLFEKRVGKATGAEAIGDHEGVRAEIAFARTI